MDIVYKKSKSIKHVIQGNCLNAQNKKSIHLGGRNEERRWSNWSNISSLASGASAIANSVNKKKAEDKKNSENEKNNKAMERKAFLEKVGGGVGGLKFYFKLCKK